MPSIAARALLRKKFSPKNIQGLQLWLAADRIAGMGDGDPVTTWEDLSGNSRNAAQGTSAAKPTYKTGILNNRPVVRFDGTDDQMATSASMTFKTIVVVANYDNATFRAIAEGLVCRGNASDDVSITCGAAGGTALRTTNGTIYVNGTQTSEFAPLATHKIVTKVITTGNSGTAMIGNEPGAAARFWKGDMAEILVYSVALDANSRRRLNGYLSRKYNITVA